MLVIASTNNKLKGCVHYTFASLLLGLNESTYQIIEKCFSFHFKNSFRSRENQILVFYIFKFYDVIKCLRIKQEIHSTE